MPDPYYGGMQGFEKVRYVMHMLHLREIQHFFGVSCLTAVCWMPCFSISGVYERTQIWMAIRFVFFRNERSETLSKLVASMAPAGQQLCGPGQTLALEKRLI